MRKLTFKKVIFSRTSFVLFLILLVMVARSVVTLSSKAKETKANLAQVQAQYEELLKRGGIVEEEIEFLSTQEGISAEIRDKFNVAEEGEEVIVIVDEKREDRPPEVPEPEEKGLWNKIKSVFGS